MMIICQRFEAWACNFDWAARCWCGLAGPGGTTSAGGWYFEKISWLAWLWLGRWWLHTAHHTPYIQLLELQSPYLPDDNVVAWVPGCQAAALGLRITQQYDFDWWLDTQTLRLDTRHQTINTDSFITSLIYNPGAWYKTVPVLLLY